MLHFDVVWHHSAVDNRRDTVGVSDGESASDYSSASKELEFPTLLLERHSSNLTSLIFCYLTIRFL